MMRTALLTLGRLPKALDIAQALHEAGLRVIIAEPAKSHLCKVSRYVAKSYRITAPNDDQARYLDELLDVIASENVDIVIPVSEEALHATLIADRLPQHVQLYSMPQPVLRKLHDKWQFAELARSFGLAVPETDLLGSDHAQIIAGNDDYILKPVCTCSGQGLEICVKGDPLPDVKGRAASVVQRQMKGALKSSFSIAHKGRVIGSVVYRAAILSGTVAVAFERLDGEIAIEDWIGKFIAATNYTGFISFDFMEDEGGKPHAIECNPRATSGIHFVERADIAGAILDPENQVGLRLRPYRFMQQFFPCLTETQMAFFKRDRFAEKAKVMWKAKEVNFSWSDPLPLWLMPVTSREIMKRAFLNGESFGEASTHDIGWYEDGRLIHQAPMS